MAARGVNLRVSLGNEEVVAHAVCTEHLGQIWGDLVDAGNSAACGADAILHLGNDFPNLADMGLRKGFDSLGTLLDDRGDILKCRDKRLKQVHVDGATAYQIAELHLGKTVASGNEGVLAETVRLAYERAGGLDVLPHNGDDGGEFPGDTLETIVHVCHIRRDSGGRVPHGVAVTSHDGVLKRRGLLDQYGDLSGDVFVVAIHKEAAHAAHDYDDGDECPDDAGDNLAAAPAFGILRVVTAPVISGWNASRSRCIRTLRTCTLIRTRSLLWPSGTR